MKAITETITDFARDFEIDAENGMIIAGGIALGVAVLAIAFLF